MLLVSVPLLFFYGFNLGFLLLDFAFIGFRLNLMFVSVVPVKPLGAWDFNVLANYRCEI